jgi:hypothetical protein
MSIHLENGEGVARVVDKYSSKSKKQPNKMNTYYRLHDLLEESNIGDKIVPGESHWIANWLTKFDDAEIGDEVAFTYSESEFHPDVFVHNGKRIRNVRNITVDSLTIIRV